MDVLGGAKLITAILPRGRGIPVVRVLRDEKGLAAANVNSARGTGRIAHRSLRKARTETEKDILTVVVPNDRQEEIFEFIYECAEIGRPHGGMIYQTNLAAATAYSLPDLPDEV